MDILIAKKIGEKMQFKVVEKVSKGYAPDKFLKVVNFKDYNELALLLEDLDVVMNAPVEKAYRLYKENKTGGRQFPF